MKMKYRGILGKQFRAISNAFINCSEGEIKLSFGNMIIELDVFNLQK